MRVSVGCRVGGGDVGQPTADGNDGDAPAHEHRRYYPDAVAQDVRRREYAVVLAQDGEFRERARRAVRDFYRQKALCRVYVSTLRALSGR